jgi:hypothetical protein
MINLQEVSLVLKYVHDFQQHDLEALKEMLKLIDVGMTVYSVYRALRKFRVVAKNLTRTPLNEGSK